jgi:hypothetical protein
MPFRDLFLDHHKMHLLITISHYNGGTKKENAWAQKACGARQIFQDILLIHISLRLLSDFITSYIMQIFSFSQHLVLLCTLRDTLSTKIPSFPKTMSATSTKVHDKNQTMRILQFFVSITGRRFISSQVYVNVGMDNMFVFTLTHPIITNYHL